MNYLINAIIFLATFGLNLCNGNTVYRYGKDPYGAEILKKELYRTNSTVPKNYTIIFRYLAPRYSGMLTYAELYLKNVSI